MRPTSIVEYKYTEESHQTPNERAGREHIISFGDAKLSKVIQPWEAIDDDRDDRKTEVFKDSFGCRISLDFYCFFRSLTHLNKYWQ